MGIFRLEFLDEASSTNDVVKEALERGEGEGLAVTAARQTGGYGRQGRSWASPLGGMYLSVLLRPQVPPAQLPTLSLVAAVAVRRALVSLLPDDTAAAVKVKWPNDVAYVERGEGCQLVFRKLVGISLEQHAGGLCVGIGVNVVPLAAAGVPLEGKNRPAYLAELGLDGAWEGQAAIDAVRRAVLDELEGAYLLWLDEGFEPFLGEYAGHELLAGCQVDVEDRNGAPLAAGMVEGVDTQGRLLVREEGASEPRPISSGEAHVASASALAAPVAPDEAPGKAPKAGGKALEWALIALFVLLVSSSLWLFPLMDIVGAA